MVTTEQFENYLSRKNNSLKHWALPKTQLNLEKFDSGKYYLNVVKNGESVFTNDKVSFQIHYGEKECLVGLFVQVNDRGWFLEHADIFEETNIGIGILYMFKNRFDLMKEIYEREISSQ